MKLPNKKFRTYAIALFIHRNGGATKDQCIDAFPAMQPRQVRDTVNHIYSEGMLSKSENIYKVKQHVANYFDMSEPVESAPAQIAQPADASLRNKPWSGKYSFANVPRREPIREDVSFKSGSVGFPVGLYA